MPPSSQLAPRAAQGEGLKALLEQARPRIESILPKHLSAERMVRICLAAVHRNPKLAECSPLSIVNSLIQASELGLEPGGALRHAYLIPYKGECTFQPSYMGLLELAWRSREFRQIEARAVHALDKFTVVFDPVATFTHIPCLADRRGPLTHAYAYAVLSNGGLVFEIATREEIEAARKQSRAPDSLMWTQFYDEAAKKTVLKKFLKRQPCSAQLIRAIELDNREFDLDARPAPRSAPGGRSAALGELLGRGGQRGGDDQDEEPAFREGTDGRIGVEPDEPPPEREPGEEG